jgi:ABC-type methionine transport system ATPase subunit
MLARAETPPGYQPAVSHPGGGVKLRAIDVTIHYWIERAARPFLAVDGASIEVRSGEFVAIVGPSGCGKTTFLNAVDGLQPISGGELELNGKAIGRPGADRAMVFQQASLLPWRTVMGNVVYGLELQRRTSKQERMQRAREFTGWSDLQVSRTRSRPSYPAACNSASIWRERWRSILKCCCSTSHSRHSMPRLAS